MGTIEAIAITAIHHVTLTVTDVARSQAFYERYLGFRQVGSFGPRRILARAGFLLSLGTAPDPAQAPPDDRFSPHRVGLDHLSFAVASRAELERAKALFAAEGIEHRYIKELESFAICVLAFRDPDDIALELTAPL